MGHPPVSLAPTQIEYPLPEHRRINEGIAPERIANARAAAHEVADGLVRDEPRLGCAKRAEARVHHVDMQALQVGNIARDVEREYLPLPFMGQLVAVDKALQNQAALMRAVALPHEVLTGTNGLNGPTQLTEHILLVL